MTLLGILTIRSCGLVLGAYIAAYLLDLTFGLWSRWGGEWATLGPVCVALISGLGLRLTEAHDDEHLAPSAARFYLSRRARCVYSAGCPDGFAQVAPDWMRAGLCGPRRKGVAA